MSDSTHTWLIGVDGGGTGCRAAIGTGAHGVLTKSEGGPANATSDFSLAIKNIRAAIAAAANSGDIDTAWLEHAEVYLGLAGVMSTQDSARIAAALPYHRVTVSDDRGTTVTGALDGADGYVLAIGTGTIAACSRGGAFDYVGGWGFQVADQGSGAWLGRAALEHVLLCHDGLAQSGGLCADVFAKFDHDPRAISSFASAARPGDFAKFAPDVIAAGKGGDPAARTILQEGADHLEACLTRLGFRAGDRLCLKGGVGPHYADYLPPVFLTNRVEPRGSALDGAFRLAGISAAHRAEKTR
ncbi:Glucosamine kinase GspK [Roseobacter fucihabitans]|uniref:Glucosamine kinase GspK n=1 Tax=Roseobacter fucihabitans TaxID=1537242 RepID=A0ABZ2BSW2_9RHOB|nr:BadF/BadG/BcrA/BcrD ATPase family protein [Roseobacter litoralis]MBC6965363.1 Glucosamine kinase GspK [Roseobacter litoralis]MBC6965471.1 Glucosamine kinase GspK [Roseobacter litoralis]